jgi:hypothetical protein
MFTSPLSKFCKSHSRFAGSCHQNGRTQGDTTLTVTLPILRSATANILSNWLKQVQSHPYQVVGRAQVGFVDNRGETEAKHSTYYDSHTHSPSATFKIFFRLGETVFGVACTRFWDAHTSGSWIRRGRTRSVPTLDVTATVSLAVRPFLISLFHLLHYNSDLT